MEKETLKKIFNFLEKEENRKIPFKVKLLNNYSLTDEELIVKRDLNLTNSKITSLPKGLKVGGGLSLFGCKHIESLPEGLEVGGILIINESELLKYSDKEIRKMIEPGYIKGKIIRS